MATHTVYAGDTWTFETTLLDSDGNGITALDDAWFSIYTDQDTVIVTKQLADSEVTLATNVLTVALTPATTTAIADGTYYLDVKIDVTGGSTTTVTFRDRVRVLSTSPLYDDY